MNAIVRFVVLTLCVGFTATAARMVEPATTASVAVASTANGIITEYRLPPNKLERAKALYRTRVAMLVVGTIYGLVVIVFVLASGLAPRFRDIAERATKRRFFQSIVFAPLLLFAMDVLSLPVSLYGHHLQRSYGLSVQSWASWFWDWVKGELVGTAIATFLVFGLYAILRRSPRRWWFYGWLASIPVVVLLVLIHPIFIDPLFNKFASLEEKQPQLLTQIEKVMRRGGLSIERSRMFEMQASDKVTTYNAYVTGIGASKRVVVWDNTSRDMTISETMFVFGHEQGHYVLNHIWQLLTFAILGLLVGMYLAYRSVGVVLAGFGRRWGIRDLCDWASLPVLMLLLSVFGLIGQPIMANFSRHLEHQADIYGLEVIHGLTPDSSQVAAHAFQKLGEKALAYPNPNPMYVFFVFDHPPLHERTRLAAKYRPWDQGQATRYIK